MNYTLKKISIALVTGIALMSYAQAETRMSLAHVASVDHPLHAAAETFAKVAKKESNGELDIRIFPNSQLGKAKEVREGIQQGTVDIGFDSLSNLSNFHPLAGIDSMPYLFRDADHYFTSWNGPTGTEIKDLIAKEANFRIIGHLYRGSRELTSNVRISSIKDLAGLKIRVTPIKERLETWKAFGANPTPMAWSEVFTSLQQGVIDAQENPLATIDSQKLYEVQKYLILTSHMANGFTFIFNAKRFEAFPETTKAALRIAAKAASAQFNEQVKNSRQHLIAKLKKAGMEVIQIDQAPFREKALDVVALFPDLQSWYSKMVAE